MEKLDNEYLTGIWNIRCHRYIYSLIFKLILFLNLLINPFLVTLWEWQSLFRPPVLSSQPFLHVKQVDSDSQGFRGMG